MCRTKACWKVATGLRYPNGLIQAPDGLIYVPSSMTGEIAVFEHVPREGFRRVALIKTNYSLDNISVDKNGDLYVAALPSALKLIQAFNDPLNSRPPAAALRIRKDPETGAYNVAKVLEDPEGEIISGATTVLHDAETGRLFFSSRSPPLDPHLGQDLFLFFPQSRKLAR